MLPVRVSVFPLKTLTGYGARWNAFLTPLVKKRSDVSAAGVYPAVNIAEDAEAYYVSAELPGVKSEDLDLNVTANQLSLTGERKINEEDVESRYHRREREAGRFSRAIALPGDIDPENVRARLVDGVLTRDHRQGRKRPSPGRLPVQ